MSTILKFQINLGVSYLKDILATKKDRTCYKKSTQTIGVKNINLMRRFFLKRVYPILIGLIFTNRITDLTN